MELPIFKGTSEAQISLFLEKTHIEFKKYAPGEYIVRKGEKCDRIRYIFSGDVRLVHTEVADSCTLSEVLAAGSLIAADHMFGMDTNYPCDAVAESKASILQFSKEQFFNLLQSEPIYLLNCLNYLSLRAQRPVLAVKMHNHGSLYGQLALWVLCLTDRRSTDIRIECSHEDICRLTNLPSEEVKASMKKLEDQGKLTCRDGVIHIASRMEFLEEA